MAGRLVRGFCTAAAATVAVGSLVAGGPASAQPGQLPLAPGPAAGSEGSATAAQRGPHVPGRPPGAGEPSVAALLTDLQRLYRQSEKADAAYRAARKKLQRHRGRADAVSSRLVRARHRLHTSRAAAGRIARLQYQGSTEISPYVRLLLARDPQHALEQSRMLQRVSAARATVVRHLMNDEQRARGLSARAHRALQAQQARAERQRKQRDAVRARLHTVERLLAEAGAARDRNRPRTFPQNRTPDTETGQGRRPAWGAPQSLLAKALNGRRPPSQGGSRALQFAIRQIGKPYRWGATGPDAFDCSGLTSQAWAHAGHRIPRTSQAQWAQLPRVPLDALRPGDLVVYYPTATHVALYAGNGMVVQAPRSGERIKMSPVHANPVLGAVRPDQ